jgi:serine/threonine protein phosphatase PrpC
MADIFISYSSTERSLAASLAAELTSLGYSVWWDYEIVGGAKFRNEIRRELTAARAVIVLWTLASIESHWVQEEADDAQYNGKLVPIRAADLDPRQLPLGFRSLQTLLNGDREGLQRALSRLLGTGRTKGGFDIAEGRRTGTASVIVDHFAVVRAPAEEMVRLLESSGQHVEYEALAVLVDGRAFDGFGSAVSREAVDEFVTGFKLVDTQFGKSRSGALRQALNAANEAVDAALQAAPTFAGKCCPIVAAYVHRNELTWISAGDCGLLLYRDGLLYRLNDNHSVGAWLDKQAAAGRITRAEAQSARDRQAQRSGLTGSDIPLIDTPSKPHPIRSSDWIILATQGLETLAPDEIAACIATFRNGPAETLVAALLHSLDEKHRLVQDNAAVIALRPTT